MTVKYHWLVVAEGYIANEDGTPYIWVVASYHGDDAQAQAEAHCAKLADFAYRYYSHTEEYEDFHRAYDLYDPVQADTILEPISYKVVRVPSVVHLDQFADYSGKGLYLDNTEFRPAEGFSDGEPDPVLTLTLPPEQRHVAELWHTIGRVRLEPFRCEPPWGTPDDPTFVEIRCPYHIMKVDWANRTAKQLRESGFAVDIKWPESYKEPPDE